MKDRGNYTDENWEAELAENYSKLGLKQKKALRAFYKYHKKIGSRHAGFSGGEH